ncbi:MAG TPA: MFS transporter [Solirubrobacteraceae bacterium]|nr:MFS transporter [Solirubrobacteraceae bacterium]
MNETCIGALGRREVTFPGMRAGAGVFAATLSCFLAIGAVLPVLPRYVRGPVGAGSLAVGVVVGAFALTAVVGRPWAGRLADRRGRRPVLIAGSLLMAAGGALLFLPAGVPELVLARLVLGAGEGLLFTAGTTWVVDLAPESRRGQAIGLFGLSVWSGLTAGPLLGEGLFAAWGYDAVWALAVIGPLGGALLASRLFDPHRPGPPSPTRSPLLPAGVLGPGLALALANAGYATMAAFIALHLNARGVGHGAAVFTAYAAAVVGTRLLAGRLPDRIGARRSAVAAGVAEAAGLALIASASAWWTAVAGGLVMGVGFSLLYPALALAVVQHVDPRQRGAGVGGFTAFFDIGVGVGAPLAGAIASLAGYGAAFWGAAAMAAGAALIAARTAGGSAPVP